MEKNSVQNVIICIGKVPRKKTRQVHVCTEAVLLLFCLLKNIHVCIQNFIFKVRSEGIPVYFYIRVKNKNKYYLSGHFIWFLK